jgi:anti-anti-sigma factor
MASPLTVPGVTVDEHVYDDVVVLDVRGEVDLAVSPALWERLETHVRSGKRVVIDLTDVAFIDSSGLALLVRAHRDAQWYGGSLHLRGGEQLRRALSITELDGYLELER